jgi:DNA-binding NarL/FixJ family response regulator
MTPIITTLTRREITVLRHVAQGWNARAISGALHVTRRTIHYYFTSIKNKLGVHTMEEVMFIAGRDGLLGEYAPDEEV